MISGIVIGGAPSSGSSLLNDLIGRHSVIRSFPETHLLAKPVLWGNWNKHKEKLLSQKWKSPDWHLHSGVSHITESELAEQAIKGSSSVLEFAHRYFSEIAKQQGKQIWCEKTPANVYFFNQLKHDSITIKPVLCIRNPFDIIASLLFRNMNLIDAVSRTLINFGVGHAQLKKSEIITIKYEDLVTNPELCLQNLFQQLDIEFENQLLENRNGNTKMDGWKHAEDGVISKSSIGRFSELTTKQQSDVIYAVSYTHLTLPTTPYV